jgi:hypothetical protein
MALPSRKTKRTAATRPSPRGEPRTLPITWLRLDPENPRLPESTEVGDEPSLVQILARDYSLLELGQSLADNGYFAEEPLAVIHDPDQESAERFLVIEGNRRLAALELLTDASLRQKLRMTEWDALAQSAKYDLSKVPCIVYDHRSDLISFMGFRHITGVKAWEPLAKARFIHSLVRDHQLDFKTASRRIGSKANSVRHQYLVHRIYLQARDEFELDVSGIERDYGVFTRAMSSGPLREYIGLSTARENTNDPARLDHPVAQNRKTRLRDVISWISGIDSEPSVLGDSRQITTLGEVVSNTDALALLKSSRNLSLAQQLLPGEEARLLEHLAKAAYHLDEALKDAHRHRKSKKVASAVTRCDESLDALHQLLKQ